MEKNKPEGINDNNFNEKIDEKSSDIIQTTENTDTKYV